VVTRVRRCADVENLQKRFVRYSSDTSAETVACGWSKDASARAQQRRRQDSAPSASAMAALPEAVSLQIVRAPAEYAVPVKQDRCAARRAAAVRDPCTITFALPAHCACVSVGTRKRGEDSALCACAAADAP
jgi:hypothetical protein